MNTDDEIMKLATEEAQQLIASLYGKDPASLEEVVRDAIIRGMAIGSRFAVSQAETHLTMMRAQKK